MNLSQPREIKPLFFIAMALFHFGLPFKAQAVTPPPDGAYPGGNTAEGLTALFSLTTGGYNTAVGFFSQRVNNIGSFNTAVGAGTLLANTANNNTATGAGALLSNTTATDSTADGAFALFGNTTGQDNTASGSEALMANTTGSDNTAAGAEALLSNTTGIVNTATGATALANNTTGNFNTADGGLALINNTTGTGNTTIGEAALAHNTTGNNNIAVGSLAGQDLTTGDFNIDIGNIGVAGEANTIRIGDDTHQGATFIAGVYGMTVSGLQVVMDSSDHLGTLGSSRRFKDDIKPMAQTSETILALQPVTFRYKKEIDPSGTAQFGLVAEEVDKVNPALVVRDKEGRPYSVRYDAVNAMLLNEFLKEHKAFVEQQQKVDELQSTVATLLRTVKEQAAEMQKVSALLQLSNTAPQTVSNAR